MGRAGIASTVVASASALALLSVETASAASGAGRPSNFTVAVSGQTLTAQQLVPKLDTYVPVPRGPLTIAVRWTTNLRGTNHRVVITASNGADRKQCVTGTSCDLAMRWSLARGQVTCFSVLVYSRLKQVSDRDVCVVGRK